jgi:hypothetical protein
MEAVAQSRFGIARCAFAEVHARATVRDDLAMDGPPATDEMAVFGAHP